MPESLSIDPDKTALVLIDLQKGILQYPGAPYATSTVLSNAVKLANAFRKENAPVVLIHVGYSADGKDAVSVPTDASLSSGDRPDNWMEIAPELGPEEGDIIIKKRQWGGFYGTELDLQLRRRGIKKLVIGGIATNFGVESTARDAFERNYEQFFPEDAMTGLNEEAHLFAIENIFPRMGHVRSTDELLAVLKQRFEE